MDSCRTRRTSAEGEIRCWQTRRGFCSVECERSLFPLHFLLSYLQNGAGRIHPSIVVKIWRASIRVICKSLRPCEFSHLLNPKPAKGRKFLYPWWYDILQLAGHPPIRLRLDLIKANALKSQNGSSRLFMPTGLFPRSQWTVSHIQELRVNLKRPLVN